jgi:hypothetical protein
VAEPECRHHAEAQERGAGGAARGRSSPISTDRVLASWALDELSRRVSEADREQAVVSLREDLLAGRLTLDEFSERVEMAYRARIGEELVAVREGLPDGPSEPVRGRRRPTRLTAGLFSHVVRRGRLRLKRWTLAVAAFADVDLDLREAEMDSPQTAMTVLVVLGNVDVYAPDGIDVDVGGITAFGHRREWGRDAPRPGAPRVHVRTLALFGTVDVWRVPHEMRGRNGEITEQLERAQRQLPG